MKILILVQSIDIPSRAPYRRLRQAQIDTWDSIPHPNVDVIYYFPGTRPDELVGNELHITCQTHWTYMFFNLAKAMRHMLKNDMTWDYIFKTDNSSYVDKAKLYEILLTKPREKYYGGSDFLFKTPQHKVDFMWGDGYALSRDMVAYIVGKYNQAPLKGKQEDDIVVGQLMHDVANWDKSLTIRVPMLYKNEVELGHHVYRCRIDNISYSPAAAEFKDLDSIVDNDIMMMNKIHQAVTAVPV
jgi:hypothetical protein